jgi:Carboxypeptidase regulatory-like domain
MAMNGHRSHRLILVVALAVWLVGPGIPTPAAAPSSPAVPACRGIPVKIRVIGGEGRPIPGARVVVEHEGEIIDQGVTDARGERRLENVPPGGDTMLTASHAGLVPARASLDKLDPRDAALRLRPGLPVEGIVLGGADGTDPVVGAQVRVCDGGDHRIVAETDLRGRFRLDAVPVGVLFDVDVEAGVRGWTTLDEIILVSKLPLRFVLPPTRGLSGRVVTVDAEGKERGVPGIRVHAEAGVGGIGLWGISCHGSRPEGTPAVTDVSGRFRLEGLTGELRRIVVTSDSWKDPEADTPHPVTATGIRIVVVPRAKKASRRDRPTSRIRGRLLGRNGPIAGARVFARREVELRDRVIYHDWNSAFTGPDGRFEISTLAAAEYRFGADPIGHEPVRRNAVAATVAGMDMGDLSPRPFLSRLVRVVTEDGAPVPSATVSLEKLAPAAGRPVAPDGTVSIQVPPAGRFILVVDAPGRVDVHVGRADLPSTGPIEIELRPICAIVGILRDVEGGPLPSVPLYAGRSNEWHTKTDLAGRFRLTYDRPGEYRLIPSARDHHFPRRIMLRTGEPEVEIRAVRPAVVAGRVAGKSGCVVGVEVHLFDDAGERLGRTKTDEGGRFRFEGLVGRTFVVRVELEDPDQAVRLPEWVRGGTEDLEVVVETAVPVVGVVVRPDGTPAVLARVWAEPDGHSASSRSTSTDENGRFRLRGLLSASWTVWAQICDLETDVLWKGKISGVRPGQSDLRLVLRRVEDDD